MISFLNAHAMNSSSKGRTLLFVRLRTVLYLLLICQMYIGNIEWHYADISVYGGCDNLTKFLCHAVP